VGVSVNICVVVVSALFRFVRIGSLAHHVHPSQSRALVHMVGSLKVRMGVRERAAPIGHMTYWTWSGLGRNTAHLREANFHLLVFFTCPPLASLYHERAERKWRGCRWGSKIYFGCNGA
jgi:hypothetical protein